MLANLFRALPSHLGVDRHLQTLEHSPEARCLAAFAEAQAASPLCSLPEESLLRVLQALPPRNLIAAGAA